MLSNFCHLRFHSLRSLSLYSSETRSLFPESFLISVFFFFILACSHIESKRQRTSSFSEAHACLPLPLVSPRCCWSRLQLTFTLAAALIKKCLLSLATTAGCTFFFLFGNPRKSSGGAREPGGDKMHLKRLLQRSCVF